MDSPRVCWADHSSEVKNLNQEEGKVSAKTRKLIFPGALRFRGQLASRQQFSVYYYLFPIVPYLLFTSQ